MLASQKPCQVALTECHQSQDTLNLVRVLGNMAGRNESQPSGPGQQVQKKGMNPIILPPAMGK